MTETNQSRLDHVHDAMLEAIDSNIAGESTFPDSAVFIDADGPGVGAAILDAASRGKPVVLCSADGKRQVMYPSEPAEA